MWATLLLGIFEGHKLDIVWEDWHPLRMFINTDAFCKDVLFHHNSKEGECGDGPDQTDC